MNMSDKAVMGLARTLSFTFGLQISSGCEEK